MTHNYIMVRSSVDDANTPENFFTRAKYLILERRESLNLILQFHSAERTTYYTVEADIFS